MYGDGDVDRITTGHDKGAGRSSSYASREESVLNFF